MSPRFNRSARRHYAVPLAGLIALAGCWDSDGFVEPRPSEPDAPPTTCGPLGDAIAVDGQLTIHGLSAPADIVRDTYGVVHIYAQTRDDAFRVQGFTMARDRALQIELLRRAALGRLAEVFGEELPDTIDRDIAMRTLGLGAIADQELALMQPSLRSWVEAFADGVNQYFEAIRDGVAPMPPAGPPLRRTHFEPFSPSDVLAIDKLVQLSMSLPVAEEAELTRFVHAVRTGTDDDEALQRRKGMVADVLRFAPLRSATTVELVSRSSPSPRGGPPVTHAIPSAYDPALDAWRDVAAMVGVRGAVGSNAWAVSPERSASAGVLLAADAHFALTSPPALWLVHMQITNQQGDPDGPFVAGAALAGLPGAAYGFHRDLAWAPVASYFDNADLYVEQLDTAATGVLFEDAIVPIEVRTESILVAGGSEVVIEVRSVPHHGPLIPVLNDHQVAPLEPSSQALSVRWTGLEPTRDLEASLALLGSKGVEQALAVVGAAPSSVRGYVFADSNDTMYVGPMRIVKREPGALAWDALAYEGTLPCLALPGGGGAEWVGTIPQPLVPYARDPDAGFVIAANSDPTDGTHDNDPTNDSVGGEPLYLGARFDIGFRHGRLHDRLTEVESPLTLEDAGLVQGDVRSELAAMLVPHLREAIERARKESETPGTYPSLTALVQSGRFDPANALSASELVRRWGVEADFETLAGVKFADMGFSSDETQRTASRASLMFYTWLVHVVDGVFGDELTALGIEGGLPDDLVMRSLVNLLERQPSALATFDPEMRDSALWDDLSTPVLESRDERLVTALLDAWERLTAALGDDVDGWRWGVVHTVRMESFDPSWSALSIPAVTDGTFPDGFPRPGGLYTVDLGGFDVLSSPKQGKVAFGSSRGAALRFAVAFVPDGLEAVVALAGGQVADPEHANFRDGAEYWRYNETHPLVHGRSDVLASVRSREVATKHEVAD